MEPAIPTTYQKTIREVFSLPPKAIKNGKQSVRNRVYEKNQLDIAGTNPLIKAKTNRVLSSRQMLGSSSKNSKKK
ncbi:MAG TPA: hypothetical protein VN873_18090 [Candidatus Angelobacter sp.]|nr:hypothetical protein [Candidatus Angelobacter sp.]